MTSSIKLSNATIVSILTPVIEIVLGYVIQVLVMKDVSSGWIIFKKEINEFAYLIDTICVGIDWSWNCGG